MLGRAALAISLISILPASAQTDLRSMPPAVEAAAKAAPDARMEAIVRREYAACVADQSRQGDSKGFECNGILAWVFAEARRRDLRALSEWAVRGVTASIYDPVDARTSLTLLGEAGRILSSADYPRSLPFHAAYVEDTLADPNAGADALAELRTRAERYETLGLPATDAIYAGGAATLARRIEGAGSVTASRMDAQALRAWAMLGREEAARRCASDPAASVTDAGVRLHVRVSCAIAAEQAGRWRDAEAQLRALLPEAQAQDAPQARADLLMALGRNLTRQELYDAAVGYLTTARDLLAPLVMEEDERNLRAPAIRAARAQGALNIATGFRDMQTSGVHRNLTGIYKLEAKIAAADTWAMRAEALQRQIDGGSLRWEGGVWRQMLYAYGDAAEEARRLIGRDAPIVAMLRAKDAQGREQFLTEGFRRPLSDTVTERELVDAMNAAAKSIASLPWTDRYRIEGLQVAAGFMARNRRNVPEARSLCRSAMDGAIERMRSHGEFDAAAQAQLRRRAPLFAECVKVAWLSQGRR
ncbi:hypothetical protein ABS767_11015 [Sphingomonas sp. ST-64]|uniref:Uncharacterized protein n=1 Tax=Sphingomonas plantiphila TaxID=3163295 RepID=A0ABW8YNL7_9SPHN